MSKVRKLQAEIESTCRKLQAHVNAWNEDYDIIRGLPSNEKTSEQHQYLKIFDSLKSSIRKLIKTREQVRDWISSGDIKDQSVIRKLEDARCDIESCMERFRGLERENKISRFSIAGLERDTRDPEQKAKVRCADWITDCVNSLEKQVEQMEADQEALAQVTAVSNAHDQREEQLAVRIRRHQDYVTKLERTLRLLANDEVEPQEVYDALKDSLDYYIESAYMDEGFIEDEGMWDLLPLEVIHENVGKISKHRAHGDMGGNIVDSNDNDTTNVIHENDDSKDVHVIDTHHENTIANKNNTRRDDTVQHVDNSSHVRKEKAGEVGAEYAEEKERKHDFVDVFPCTMSPVHTPSLDQSHNITQCHGQYSGSTSWSKNSAEFSGSSSLKSSNTVTTTSSTTVDQLGETSARGQKYHPHTLQQQQQQSMPLTPHAAYPTSGGEHHHVPPFSLSVHVDGIGERFTPTTSNTLFPCLSFSPSSGSSVCSTRIAPHFDSIINNTHDGLSVAPAHIDLVLQQSCPHLPSLTTDAIWSYESKKDPACLMMQPCVSPPSYPTQSHMVPTIMSDPSFYDTLPQETLFFTFFFRPGTPQQLLAANQLKFSGWRFHKKIGTWFARTGQPNAVTESYEEGLMAYWDHGGRNGGQTWGLNTTPSRFRFEYSYLENENTVVRSAHFIDR